MGEELTGTYPGQPFYMLNGEPAHIIFDYPYPGIDLNLNLSQEEMNRVQERLANLPSDGLKISGLTIFKDTIKEMAKQNEEQKALSEEALAEWDKLIKAE